MEYNREYSDFLKKSGVENFSQEAHWIAAAAANDDELQQFLHRRSCGEPLQYILGEWDFFGLTLRVGKGVLIPRPETELLVEQALRLVPENAVVIDLFTGSGCVPAAIANNKSDVKIFAIEKSEEAVYYAKYNIDKYLLQDKVAVVQADVLTVVTGAFPKADIITANPPYVRDDFRDVMQKELTFEPEMAIFGGEDGLYFYREVVPKWRERLKPGGMFMFECGDEQGAAVSDILRENGFRAEVVQDYSRLDRVVIGEKPI
ncbi:release factor glutamine methyltransferase [Clostridia bacterium]|nr:release factor glutamine methyltransferase [Clostridia bacterium]